MFERYTEESRRAVFFGRYEASESGSPYIESTHLLLGVLRQRPRLIRDISSAPVEVIEEECRKAIGPPVYKTSTSVDLPVSNECKRSMTRAAEEADRLQSKHIGLQHLTLGLLCESETVSGILTRHGITADKVRALPTFEGGSFTAQTAVLTSGAVEFVCDDKLVWRVDFSPVIVWPRVGETIVLDQEGSPQQYTVMDVSHIYAAPKDPANQRARLTRVVVTLRASKPNPSTS